MTPEALAALHASCFPDAPWSAADFASLKARRDTRLYHSPHSLLVLSVIAPEAEILTLGTDPAHRRSGLAQNLFKIFLREHPRITTVFLEVAEDNHAARALYARLGFAQTGRRAAYYRRASGPAADALTLTFRSCADPAP